MINELDNFYLQKKEPFSSCLLALRDIILKQDIDIVPDWKYSTPFFSYKGKNVCYLSISKAKELYIGFIEGRHLDHTSLVSGNRTQIKILPINPDEDLPVEFIEDVVKQAIDLYKMGVIKTKK
jgi:hypothetical protein